MNWNKPETNEIKMDAEISSYQDDSYDPAKDGPLFCESAPRAPQELEAEQAIPRA